MWLKLETTDSMWSPPSLLCVKYTYCYTTVILMFFLSSWKKKSTQCMCNILFGGAFVENAIHLSLAGRSNVGTEMCL